MPSLVSFYAMLLATLVVCDCDVEQKVCPGDVTACASAIYKHASCKLSIVSNKNDELKCCNIDAGKNDSNAKNADNILIFLCRSTPY